MKRSADQRKRPSREAARKKSAAKPSSLCPVADRCGGCTSLDVAYEEQLARKRERIEALFAPLDTDASVPPVLGMDRPFNYRNKVATPYAPARKRGKNLHGSSAARRSERAEHRVLTGMYARGTHELVPTDSCLIENAEAKRATLAIRDLMEKWDIAPYDEDTGKGFLRHAVVRVGHGSGEMLVTLVTNTDEFPKAKSFCRELVKRVPAITTVVQNVNTRRTNVILGEKERTLYGPGFILDSLCDVRFRISSRSFYQVNAQQTEVLYRTAMELAKLEDLNESDIVIDAYCGTGTIGLVAAKRSGAHLIGVDSVASAIRDARLNAQHNGIENAEFVCADATEFLVEAAGALGGKDDSGHPRRGDVSAAVHDHAAAVKSRIVLSSERGVESDTLHDHAAAVKSRIAPSSEHGVAPDAVFDRVAMKGRAVLFMDPPRSGSTPAFIDAACSLAPERIVYISCDPTTQVRDVERFLSSGVYRLTALQPVDMFPHTDHIENICVLEKSDAV